MNECQVIITRISGSLLQSKVIVMLSWPFVQMHGVAKT